MGGLSPGAGRTLVRVNFYLRRPWLPESPIEYQRHAKIIYGEIPIRRDSRAHRPTFTLPTAQLAADSYYPIDRLSRRVAPRCLRTATQAQADVRLFRSPTRVFTLLYTNATIKIAIIA